MLVGFAVLSAAVAFFEEAFSDAYGIGADFDKLIGLDILHSQFETHLSSGSDLSGVVFTGGADISHLLSPYRVYRNVVILAVFADDLAGVDLFAGLDEKDAAVIQGIERVSGDLACGGGNHNASLAMRNRATHRLVSFEGMMHNCPALCGVEHSCVQAEKTAGRYEKFHMDEVTGAAFGVYFKNFTSALAHKRHYGILAVERAINRKQFNRLVAKAVDNSQNHLGLADANLVTLAAHILEQDAEMHKSAAGDDELLRRLAWVDPERDVMLKLFFEAFADLPAGNVFAVSAREGAVVDAEGHRHCRLIDGGNGELRGIVGTGDSVAYIDGVEARYGADIASADGLDLLSAEAVEQMELQDFLQGMQIVGVDYGNGLAFADLSGEDAAYGDSADVIGIFDAGHEHLERGIGNDLRRGDIFYDGLENKLHIICFFAWVSSRPTLPSGGEDDGEIEGLVVCAELDEQVEDFVDDFVGAAVLAVNLVDDDDGL